jgi:hypothetical protein
MKWKIMAARRSMVRKEMAAGMRRRKITDHRVATIWKVKENMAEAIQGTQVIIMKKMITNMKAEMNGREDKDSKAGDHKADMEAMVLPAAVAGNRKEVMAAEAMAAVATVAVRAIIAAVVALDNMAAAMVTGVDKAARAE